MTTNGFAHTINSWRAGLASPTPSAQYGELINNLTSLRRGILDLAGDSRRNIDNDCGWPNSGALTPEAYRDLFDRNSIANRVVNLLPKECFQVTPEVYEKSKGSTETPFEKSWQELCKSVAGSSWHGGNVGTVVWERLKRLDILSGIGSFGILLIGLDDGMRLDEPAIGVVDKVFEGIAFNSANYLVDSPMSEAEEKKYKDMKLTAQEKQTVNRWTWQRKRISEAAAKAAASVQNAVFDDGSDNPRSPKNMLGRYDGEAPSESQQWFGTQFGDPEQTATIPSKAKRKVTFLRVFDESSVQVTRWEANVNSPRFGQPVMYRVTFNDPRDQSTGSTSMPSTTAFVHWSRVIHAADNKLMGEALGTPRLKPVYNDVVDIRKVKGSGAEGYYKSCFPILAFETHPQLGGDVDIDQDKLRQQVEQLINSLQRVVLGIGGSWKTLPPSVVDPSPHINAGIEAICIQIGCPVRIFKGSERGELASSQDDSQWNDRIRERQNGYITPVIIVPFIDRLILMGVLEPPQTATPAPPTMNKRRKWTYNAETGVVEKEPMEQDVEEETETQDEPGYKVDWPDLDSLGDSDRASIASTLTQALGAYVSSGAADIMPLFEYLTVVWQMDDEEAMTIVDAMEKHQEEVTAEQQAMAEEQGFKPEAPEGMVDPEQRDMDQEVALEKAKNGGGGGFPLKGPPNA